MKATKCCICGKKFTGHGNNADPVEKYGECCDDCNINVVVPRRVLDAKKAATRAAADAITSNPLQKHESAKLNEFVGQRVRIEFWDGDSDVGVLHKDTLATYTQNPDAPNTAIIGYYLDRDARGELHFKKSHVVKIKRENTTRLDLVDSTDAAQESTQKAAFVEQYLLPLLRAAKVGVASAKYEKDIATGEETVVVTYKDGALVKSNYQPVKKICVTADSLIALTTDVISKL